MKKLKSTHEVLQCTRAQVERMPNINSRRKILLLDTALPLKGEKEPWENCKTVSSKPAQQLSETFAQSVGDQPQRRKTNRHRGGDESVTSSFNEKHPNEGGGEGVSGRRRYCAGPSPTLLKKGPPAGMSLTKLCLAGNFIRPGRVLLVTFRQGRWKSLLFYSVSAGMVFLLLGYLVHVPNLLMF